jgi:hypothetical protein
MNVRKIPCATLSASAAAIPARTPGGGSRTRRQPLAPRDDLGHGLRQFWSVRTAGLPGMQLHARATATLAIATTRIIMPPEPHNVLGVSGGRFRRVT